MFLCVPDKASTVHPFLSFTHPVLEGVGSAEDAFLQVCATFFFSGQKEHIQVSSFLLDFLDV